jgi:hypothetical protein
MDVDLSTGRYEGMERSATAGEGFLVYTGRFRGVESSAIGGEGILV